MTKLYFLAILTLLTLNANIAFNGYSVYASEYLLQKDSSSHRAGAKNSGKISDTRINKPDFLRKGLSVHITPFKPIIMLAHHSGADKLSAKADTQEDDEKILSNVKVFPNPVEDELNLSFKVNKDSNVTIKIMDVLGNEITTLLSTKVMAGEQNSTFKLGSILNSGFYFIRLIVDDEVIVKRISVL